MCKHQSSVTYDSTFRNRPINTNLEKGYGCRIKELNKLIDVIEYCAYSRVKNLVIRLDLHIPQEYDKPFTKEDKNKLMRRLRLNLTKELDNNDIKKKSNPFVITTVEKTSFDKHSHFHCLILVNGNIIQSPHKVFKIAEKTLEQIFGIDSAKGLVNYCLYDKYGHKTDNPIMIDRSRFDFEQQINKAIYISSYLVKDHDKDHREKGEWGIYSTRVNLFEIR